MLFTPKRKTALIAFLLFDALIVVALVLLFQLRGDRQSEAELREIGTTIYPEPRAISDFRLLDETGEVFTQSDFEGHWNLVFFGFTNCPDICPLTMAELKQLYERMESDAIAKPRVFLVTVDPERDNPASMAAYLAKYNSDFIGLSGDPEAIAQLAGELYVAYGEASAGAMPMDHEHEAPATPREGDGTDYLINHSGHIAVIDPNGDYVAVMRAPHRDRDLLKAFAEIIR